MANEYNILSPLMKQLFVASGPQLAAFSLGGVSGYPNVILEQFKANDSLIHVDLGMTSWLGSIHGLATIPTIFTPMIMQATGRKISFIVGCLMIVLGWALIYFAQNISTILLAECFHGLGSSTTMIVSVFTIGEMINPEYRSISLTLYGVFQVIGISAVGIIGRYVDWRSVCLIMCSPVFIALCIGCVWPESPCWLAWKGKYEESATAFKWLRGSDEKAKAELAALLNCHKENSAVMKKREENRKRVNIGKQIFRRDFYLPCFQAFICYCLVFWSGNLVVLIYAMDIIRNTTKNEKAAFYGMILIDIISSVGVICTVFLLKVLKNKTVLISSTLGGVVCLLLTSIITYVQTMDLLSKPSLLSLYGLLGFMVFSSFGLTTTTFSLASELIPVKHRGLGGAFLIISMGILHTSALKISPYLFVYLGYWGTFLVYAANQILCITYIWKYVPETKFRTLTELEDFYNHGKFVHRNTDDFSTVALETENVLIQ